MSIQRVVGIDFGTSTSLIKVKAYRDGKPVDGDPTLTHYVEFDGKNMVPTLIRVMGDEEIFGHDTKQAIPGSVLYRNFKLELQSPDDEIRTQAEKLTQKFFRFLHERYSEQSMHFGQFDEEHTLVSYPAKWSEKTRDFMIQAAKDAGFQNVRGMDEPTAALCAVMAQEAERLMQQGHLTANQPSYVLMIDMGAGTTDLALCKYIPGGENTIIDTWPPAGNQELFGGREMDELLTRYLLDYLKQCDVPEKMINNFEKQNLESCKSWKENSVSGALRRDVKVPYCDFLMPLLMMVGSTPPPFPAIDRIVLEDYCKDYIECYVSLISGAMEHACRTDPGFAPEKLSLAVLTGGHSQWYFAGDMLCGSVSGHENQVGVRLRPEQVISLSQPQGTVSSGLVFSVQNFTGKENTKEVYTPENEPQSSSEQPAAGSIPQENSFLEQAKAMARQEGTLELSGEELGKQSQMAYAAGDIIKGAKYRLLAAKAGHALSYNFVAQYYEEGIEGLVEPDLQTALNYLEKGIEAGMPVNPARLARIKSKLPKSDILFDVVLKGKGSNVVRTIKTVRDIAGIELIEAKNIVDSEPHIVKTGVSRETAENIKTKLAEVGAAADIIPSSAAVHPEKSDPSAGPVLRYPQQVKQLQLQSLTGLTEADCDRMLMETSGNLKQAFRNFYSEMVGESDEDFILRVTQKDFSHIKVVNEQVKKVFESVSHLQKNEKFLFYYNESIFEKSLNTCCFVTNQRAIHICKSMFSKKYKIKKTFSNETGLIDFQNVISFGIMKFDSTFSLKCGSSGTESCYCLYFLKIDQAMQGLIFMAAACLRWRAQHGLDPYDIQPITE